MIHTITVAFCPASQLARCLKVSDKHHYPNHVIVQGYYPINKNKGS